VKESDLATQLARALPVMQELASLGLLFVLDEFGRGLGALDHLRSLPIAAVKLDTTLVQGLAHDKFGATLVRTMTELAHAMNLEVFAPAVEDVATLRQLHAMGLYRAQGFVLGRPGGDAAETIPAPDDFIEFERSR
jgi:EAL domain-containing protein (putative c-di-GMP-specific phosphodiesterase class I)